MKEPEKALWGLGGSVVLLLAVVALLWACGPIGCRNTVAVPIDRITSFSWTAVPRAVKYEIRYSTSMVTLGTWFDNSIIADIPVTVIPGDKEFITVTLALEPDTWYYFSARGINRIGVYGLFGNVDSIWTDPVEVPGAITDLAVE